MPIRHVAHSAPIPSECGVRDDLHDADFADAFAIELNQPEQSALDIYLRMVARTPNWVGCLVDIRNRSVALAGLKTDGIGPSDPSKPASAYRAGDQLGVFSIAAISDTEVILVASDKHLTTRCSILKRTDGKRNVVVMTSVVHIHNSFGRAYMVVVGPMHKLVVRAMLTNAGL